jgi:hypothetical protein
MQYKVHLHYLLKIFIPYFQVCVKERDLLPGTFEHSATLELIADRCNRVIVIISEAFMMTNLNKFLMSYAQSIGIGES